jgi:hypothetical protein
MKYAIKHRYTDAVLYETDIPDDTPSGLQCRVALDEGSILFMPVLRCVCARHGAAGLRGFARGYVKPEHAVMREVNRCGSCGGDHAL